MMKSMQIPKLQIQSKNAEIGLNIQQPKQHIEQPQADMEIKQPAAELSINIVEGQMKIDASKARSEYGFASVGELAKRDAQKGMQDILAGIARRAREGDMLMSIEKGNNDIGQIVDSKTSPENKTSGITFIPSGNNSVKFEYTPADVQVDIKKNDPEIDVEINKPIYNYTPGKVKVEMLQDPTIKIDWLV